MKLFAPLLLFIVLPVFCLHAREISFTTIGTAGIPGTFRAGPEGSEPATYSSAVFLAHKQRRKRDPMVKAGAIVAITGGGLFVGGVWTLLLFGTGDDHQAPNKSATDVGLGLMATGAALAITGGVLVKIAHNKLYKYSWQLVAPKNNEIGLAYNFM